MAVKTELPEKESTLFTEEKPSVPRNSSSLNAAAMITTKQPEMDELLEKTLHNAKFDESLTKRETEILKLIVAGKTNKKISKEIRRTERTVEYHRQRLMLKLGAHSAADLVKRAIIMELV
jgi:DNA-binding NarL/FixJ family response regulator